MKSINEENQLVIFFFNIQKLKNQRDTGNQS